MPEDNNQKFIEFTKKILRKLKPRFSFHYVAYTTLFLLVIFSTIKLVGAATPNPGHPWVELGDGVFTVANTQTVNRTYTFPDANATILTTNAAVTVAQGGTNLTSIADKTLLVTSGANTLSALTIPAGQSVRRNATDTAFEAYTPGTGMTWPAGGAGIPNYSGSSSWGTSYTTTGSGTVVALATTPTFTTRITTPIVLGGTATTQDLTLQTTSGAGTTGADMHFLVGSNGATEALTILNSGYVGIGETSPDRALNVKGVASFGDLAANSVLLGFLDISGNDRGLVTEDTNKTIAIEMGGIFGYGGGDVDSPNLSVIGTSGNVGLSTGSPTNLLSLSGTAARTIWMERNTTAATAGQGLTLSSGGAIAGTNNLAGGDLNLKSGISTGTGTSSLRFFTATAGSTGAIDNAPTEKMTILGNGNVGIGRTNPSFLLDISGNMRVASTILGDGVSGLMLDTVSSSPIVFLSNGSERMRILTGGNVGIGTTTPLVTIPNGATSIKGLEINNGTDDPILTLGTSTVGVATNLWQDSSSGDTYLDNRYDSDSGNIFIRTKTAGTPINALTVLGNGNVGIGNTNPQQPFTVGSVVASGLSKMGIKQSDTNPYNGIWVESSGNNNALYIGHTGTYGAIGTHATGIGGPVSLVLNQYGGNVGIGATIPSQKLEVDGNLKVNTNLSSAIYIGDNTASTGYNIISMNGDTGNNFQGFGGGSGTPFYMQSMGDLIFRSGGTNERIRILTGGNVGIGTTGPIGTLDVANATLPVLNVRSLQNDANWTTNLEYGKLGFYTSDLSGTGARTTASISVVNDYLSTISRPNGALAFSVSALDLTASEAMRISSAGNVGIGTTSPASLLNILGQAPVLTITGNADDREKISFKDETLEMLYISASYANEGIRMWSAIDQPMAFGTNDLERMTIFANGNVGIGQTAPTASLHIKAGTATAGTAPLKLTAGTNLSTTEAGAVEYDGSHLYFTATNGGARYQLDQQGGMTWPAGGAGIPNYSGSSSWGTSYTTTGSGTVVALQTSPSFTTPSLGVATATSINNLPLSQDNTDFNVKVGQDAGLNIVAGATNNTFLGYQSGMSSSTLSTNAADNNTAVGYRSLYSNRSGAMNVAIGTNALMANTVGDASIAIGSGALDANTNGAYNIAIGVNALTTNSSGSANVAIGQSSLLNNTASDNIAIGSYALQQNTSGILNSAFGYSALTSNSANSRSTAIGYNSMQYADNRTTGRTTWNTALGYESLRGSTTAANNTGQYNTAIGDSALWSNTSGYNNSATGVNAIYGNTTGYYNSALGYNGGRYIADGATVNATSNNSLYLGYDTRASANGNTNEIVIGASAIGNGSNTATIGNTSILRTYLTGLNLKAGTAAAGTAPLKLTSGTNLTTTEAGAVEYDGSHLYFTATNGGARYQLDQQSGGSMTWPAGGAGIPNYSGSSSWGTSYTTTGSGSILALATSPTFSTNITSPLILGGTGTTQDLSFQTTSGVGTTGADMHFLVGNNGATEAMTILNNGNVLIDGIFIGGATGTGTSNYVFGNSSLQLNTTGDYNFAIGEASLQANTTGDENIAIGSQALSFNDSGSRNTAIGVQSLNGDEISNDNIGIGYQAGFFSLAGNQNVIIGNYAGSSSVGSTSNSVYLGFNSGLSAGGANNIFLGFDSGQYETGSNKIIIDNLDRTTEALGRTSSLIYGITNATPSSQILSLGGNGRVGISTISPTARLHLSAGAATASNAPLKFTSGTNLTTTEAGAVEYDGSHLYFTATNGGTRYQLDQQGSSQWTTTGSDIYYNTGRVFVGSTSEATSGSKLALTGTTSANGSTAGVIGILGGYTFNPTAGGVQVGNRFVVTNSPTTTANTAIGETIRMVDNTSLDNLIRGLDITSNAGSNVAGTNTGLRASGATFGLQGITSGLAGGVSVPAALYGENSGTTNGDILRLYSTSMTSAPSFATFYHDTSTFTGTGLLMDFATGSGGFSGNFADFQKNNVSLFKVTNAGIVSLGLSATTSTTAVCSSLATGTSPTSGVSYELRDCSGSPVADYAEMYPVESGIEAGDIVATGDELINTYDTTNGEINWNKIKGTVTKLIKSNSLYQKNVIGIVSDNRNDFSSTGYNIKETDNPTPIALSGRVPVKISTLSESIKAGDYITTSSESGKATKALKAGFVIGKALEDWNNDSSKNTLMVFVEQGFYNGETISNFAGIEMESSGDVLENIFAKQVLNKLIENQENGEIISSEILTDRLVAGLEVITPSITTNNLRVENSTSFGGLVYFNANVEFAQSLIFKDTVEFNLPPLFNSDTAGFAVIKEGTKEVEIVFDNPYIVTPVVSTNITFEKEDVTDGEEPQTFDSENFFDFDIQSIVTNKDESGFKIILNKEAPLDVKFSWIALAVRDPKIFESVIEGLVIDAETENNITQIENENQTASAGDATIIDTIINSDLVQSLVPIIDGDTVQTQTVTETSAPVIIEESQDQVQVIETTDTTTEIESSQIDTTENNSTETISSI